MNNILGSANAFEKGALDSKKWKAMLLGVVCVMLVYASSLVMLTVLGGILADKIVSLANIVVVFLGAMISVLITGQSVVDWKNYTALETVNKTAIENKTENVSLIVSAEDLSLIKKYEEEYKADLSYMPIDYSDVEPNAEIWR